MSISLILLIASGVVSVGGIVSGILHKAGKEQAADVVDTVVRLLKALLGTLQTTTDPAARSQILAQIRSHLAELDSLGTPASKEAAAVIRKELGNA